MSAPSQAVEKLTPAEERFVLSRGEPNFADMMQLATTLLKTGFLPKQFTTPGQVLAVILTGREMGLGPMQSTRSIGIINGRPVVAADLQLALFHRAGGQSKWLILTEEKAKLWLKHPNGVEHTEEFTMQDAQRAGLDKNPGMTYQKFPKAMLRSRAITAGLKSIGFEPTTGVYDPEELGGIPKEVTPAEEIPEQERGGNSTAPPKGAAASPGAEPAPTPPKRITPDEEFPTRYTKWTGGGAVQGKCVREWALNQLRAVESGQAPVPDEWLAIVKLELKARANKAALTQTEMPTK